MTDMKNLTIEKAIQQAGGQTRLASLSGVSQAAIHKLLVRKSNNLRVSTALALSKASGIPLEEFIKSVDTDSTV